MIKYIKRTDLDIEKYNECLDNSPNSRIYAYSWYLDIVATNWDVLILDDYKAVMPLPWRQKYLIKYIYKPCWTQQLGVFSKDTIDENLVREFIKVIPRKFKKITIQFNSENPISGKGVTKKVNYILDLDKGYGELFSGFNRSRKRRVKKSLQRSLSSKKISIEEILIIVKDNYQHLKSTGEDYSRLKKLMSLLLKENKVKVTGILDLTNELIGASILLNENGRITYLFGVLTPKGKKMQAMSFFLNQIIQQNSNSNISIDFEGSMEKGIADFYKSFGAIVEDYTVFQKGISLF